MAGERHLRPTDPAGSDLEDLRRQVAHLSDTVGRAHPHRLRSTPPRMAMFALGASVAALVALVLNFVLDAARERQQRSERISLLLDDAFELIGGSGGNPGGDEAPAVFTTASVAVPADPERLARAQRRIERAIELDPQSGRAFRYLGYLHHEKNEPEAAVAALQRAVALEPDYTMAFYLLANAFFEAGRLDEAAAQYRKAIEHNPNHVFAYVGLGNTSLAVGEVDEAIELYRKALKVDAECAPAWLGLADALRQKGDLGPALAHYHSALERDPRLARAYEGMGLVYLEQGDTSQAVAHFRKAVELDTRSATGYMNLGHGLLASGQRSQAVAAYQTALARDPKLTAVQGYLEIARSGAALPPMVWRAKAPVPASVSAPPP